jgi:hypothetical protein
MYFMMNLPLLEIYGTMPLNHRKYIRIDITTLGQGHGHVCLADGNSHISPFVNFVCQGKLTTSVL